MQRVLHFAPLQVDDSDPTGAYQAVCVYRALKQYVKVTKSIRSGTNQLFVTFQPGRQGREASKTTIAGWLKSCVQEAYTRQKLPLPAVRAHSTRKQSVSWADMGRISVQDICTHASWTSSSVFTRHYKLDLKTTVSARHAQSVLGAVFHV